MISGIKGLSIEIYKCKIEFLQNLAMIIMREMYYETRIQVGKV